MRIGLLLCGFIALILALGSARGQAPLRPPLGLDEYVPVPDDNPLTPEKIALGRRLFFDKGLSADRTVACASCHEPERAFSDGRPVPLGVGGRKGGRNAPTLINRAYGRSFFWDGRVQTLEEQALHPIQEPTEMNLTLSQLTERLEADARYTVAFKAAFAGGISAPNVARALASFIRTVRSGNAPFDRFQQGDEAALSEPARQGMDLFRGKANCVACHIGPNFTDEQFHNSGVSWGSGDLGRYQVTHENRDRGAFKTPTLREITKTAPYMHDGSLATLQDVIEHYDRGGTRNPYRDPELRPLQLTAPEKQALLAFLEMLCGSTREPGSRRG